MPRRKTKHLASQRQSSSSSLQGHEMMAMNKREEAIFSNNVHSMEDEMECKCYS